MLESLDEFARRAVKNGWTKTRYVWEATCRLFRTEDSCCGRYPLFSEMERAFEEAERELQHRS